MAEVEVVDDDEGGVSDPPPPEFLRLTSFSPLRISIVPEACPKVVCLIYLWRFRDSRDLGLIVTGDSFN